MADLDRDDLADAIGETGPDTAAMAETISNDLFGDEGELTPSPSRDDDSPESSGPSASTRPRTPDGKFAAKEATAEVTPGPASPVTEQAPEAPVAPAAPLFSPPKTWRKEAAEAFATLPPLVQEEITKREQDIFRGISQYKEHAQIGQVFDTTLKPMLPLFQKYNLNPADAAKRALTAHFNLTLAAPEVKVELARTLLRDYGIPLEALGLPDGTTSAVQAQSNPILEQRISQLQQQLAEVGQTTTFMQQRYAEQVRSQTRGTVDKFADDPANIYFNDLTDDMVRLIQSGAAQDLPEAYEKAVWLNPVVRAKEIARLSAAQSAQSATQSTAKISEARRASAVNVRSQGHPTSGPADPLGSIDDTLTATMKRIKERG